MHTKDKNWRQKLKFHYFQWAVILFHIGALFVIINLIFLLIPNPLESKIKLRNSLYISPRTALLSDTTMLKRVYPNLTISEIDQRIDAPNIKSHPVLPFMNVPTVNNCYHIGMENIRYDSFTHSDTDAYRQLNKGVWVLGGSTVFGSGVCGDETISYYLNSLDTSSHYINLGCQGYIQWNEIERLILLLRKGYRPKSVIFIDGLNDLICLGRSGFEAFEISSKNPFAYELEFGIAQFKPSKKSLYFLPILYWWNSYLAAKTHDGSLPLNENIYSVNAQYNKNNYQHYLMHKDYFHLPEPALAQKMITYYKGNLTLIEKLAMAYEFNYEIFFQPIGVLHPNNSFVTNQKLFDSIFFAAKQTRYLQTKMCDEIKNGRFSHYTDMTNADKCCKEPYIELVHYSPALNLIMAKKILEVMKKSDNEKNSIQQNPR